MDKNHFLKRGKQRVLWSLLATARTTYVNLLQISRNARGFSEKVVMVTHCWSYYTTSLFSSGMDMDEYISVFIRNYFLNRYVVNFQFCLRNLFVAKESFQNRIDLKDSLHNAIIYNTCL